VFRDPRSNVQLVTLIGMAASGDDSTPSGVSDNSTGIDDIAEATLAVPSPSRK
jgi:hypothetical protein